MIRSLSLPVYLYLVDAFAFAASAVSAAALFQSLLGFAFPLFGQEMYVKLGYGGGNSLLAGLAIVIGIPFPIWIWYKGENIRRGSVAYLAPDVRYSALVCFLNHQLYRSTYNPHYLMRNPHPARV
jgi:hypothetical protein